MSLTALLQRAITVAPSRDATEERILDAARDAVGEGGTRATTMDDVARRAGVGRMTVFRRFGSKEALIERLVVRELRIFLDQVDTVLEEVEDPGERVVEAFVACLHVARTHPMLVRVAGGQMIELLGRGDPSGLELGRRFVAARLRADGDVEDPDSVADVLVRLAASYALQPAESGMALRDDDAARAFARRVLAPMVTRHR